MKTGYNIREGSRILAERFRRLDEKPAPPTVGKVVIVPTRHDRRPVAGLRRRAA